MNNNPFAQRRDSNKPPPNMMHVLINHQPKLPARNPSNLENEDQENDRYKDNPATVQNTFISSQIYQRAIIEHPVQRITPKTRVFPQKKNQTQTDRVQLKWRVNGQPCNTVKIIEKQMKIVTDLTPENIKIELSQTLTQTMNRQVNFVQLILNSLSSVFQLIRDDNQTIFSILQNRVKGDLKKYHYRLKQGLFFYSSVDNQSMKILKYALHSHPLTDATHMISSKFKMDVLKAFYVAKEVYQKNGTIKSGRISFIITEQFVRIKEGQLLALAERFIEEDKANLLKIYTHIMTIKNAESLRIFTFQEQIDILWGNLFNYNHESFKNQQTIIELFLKYWNTNNEISKIQGSDLFAMRQKILTFSLNEEIRAKILAIGIDDLLKQGQTVFNQSDFEAPFKEIFHFFIQKKIKGFDFTLAFQSLKKIEIIKAWQNHIEIFIKDLNLQKGSPENLVVCLYIYQILMKLKANNCEIPPKLKQHLIIKVIKQCSIIIGLIFLDNLCQNMVSSLLISFLMRYSQSDLNFFYLNQINLINRWSKNYTFDRLVHVNLNIIQKIIKNAIQTGDIENLERQVTHGKVCWSDLDDQNGNYHFVKTYCQQFIKFPSFQKIIQENIFSVLKLMITKNISITKSVQAYHSKIMASAKKIQILTSHLTFLFEIPLSSTQLFEYSKSCIQKAESFGMAQKVKDFEVIICTIGERMLQKDEKQFLGVFIDLLRIFDTKITIKIIEKPTLQSVIRLQYIINRVFQWSRIHQIQNSFIQHLLSNIKNTTRRNNLSFKEFMRYIETFSTQLRLFMAIQLTNTHEKQENCLNQYLSLNEDIKYYFYDKIGKDMSKQAESSIIQTFSMAAEYDKQLFITLLNKNIVNLSIFLKNFPNNLSAINDMMKIALQIATYQNIQNSQKNHQIDNSLNMIIQHVAKYFKSKPHPWNMTSKIFKICAESMNRIHYDDHMRCLNNDLFKRETSQIVCEMNENFCQYILYLVCLFIVKLKKIDMSSAGHRAKILNEIEVFCTLADATIQIPSNLNSTHLLYVKKCIQIVETLMNFSVLFEMVGQTFSKMQQSFKNRMKTSDQLKALMPSFQKIQKFMKQQSTQKIEDSNRIKDGIQDEFNKTVRAYFTKISKTLQRQQIKNEMQSLLSYIQSNKESKITLNYLINIKGILAQKPIVSIEFISILVRHISWQDCPKQTAKQFKTYLSQFDMKSYPSNSLQWMFIFKSYLQIFSQLIDCSVISPFLLFTSYVKQKIIDGIHQLANTIHYWITASSKNQLFTCLDNIELEINSISTLWRNTKSTEDRNIFTVWELILYREKVNLIMTIMRFYRVMNGLLPNHCIIVNEFTSFISFLAQNINAINSKANKQKIEAANSLIRRTSNIKTSEVVFLLQRLISLEKLRQQCLETGENLAYINYDPSPKTYEMLNKLTVPLDS